MRRGALLGPISILALAACGSAERELATAPAPLDADVAASPVAVVAPALSAEDSVADLLALEALHDLTFAGLGKGAEHVRGVVPTPTTGSFEAIDAPRGGPAAGGPTYDIDVTSFAGHERVRYYEDFFLGPARGRFTIWLGRLSRYEGMIRERFRALGIPEDLVYLALIESGYSNSAVSRANAVGMWQFIASTARRYDLRIDTWVDERRDPFKATEAAGRHLGDLYEQFGSWYLAAAAYNGGPGRVTRGLRRLGDAAADPLSDGTFFDLSDRRYLRRETRDYVPKLIAAALLAKEPLRFGFDSIPYLSPFVFDEITVPDQTGLDVLAELADTTARALMELNPHYVRGVTPPGQTAIVRVPRGTGTAVEQRYAELPVKERVSFLEHVVRKGETLSEIGQRYGVGVSLLRAANDNVHPRRVRIGRRLVIPVSSAARARAVRGDAPRPRPIVTGVRYHSVRRGDSLWKIAERYGVRISDLKHWNDIDPDESVVRVGQRLAVTRPR
jgi:membrane-bound lytic murein transglycosylase D